MYFINETFEKGEEEHRYVRPLVDKATLESIDIKCSKLIHNDFPGATTRVDEEGNEYILRDGDVKEKEIKTGFIGKKQWYRVSDRNPVSMFCTTVLGGWFGLHRLLTGNIMAFLMYLLTCGGCGVFYLTDVLMWIVGNASYEEVFYNYEDAGESGKQKLKRTREKVYYKKLPSIKMGIAGMAVSVVILLVMLNLVYRNGYMAVLEIMSEAGRRG